MKIWMCGKWIVDGQLDTLKNFGDEIGKMLSSLIITPASKKMKDLQYCHSGLSGILLRFLSACAYIRKDSRRASLAGMTLRYLVAGVIIPLGIAHSNKL